MLALRDLLKPERLTSIVDVGAAILDERPAYQRMLDEGLCTVVGFEPIPDALDKLNASKGPNETYLPDAIGDGGTHALHLTKHQGMVSFLEPDEAKCALFQGFPEWAQVLQIKRLDTMPFDLAGPAHLVVDFLKMDTQGYEREILRHARGGLVNTVAVQTEVAFTTLYKKQPTFADVDEDLRVAGFVPHCFASARVMSLATKTAIPHPDPHQLVDADLVYVRDFSQPMKPEQWKQLALVAHHILGSSDLAMLAIEALVTLGAVPDDTPAYYRQILEAA